MGGSQLPVQFIFSSHPGGLANYVLTELGLLSEPVSWMTETNTAWVIIYSLGIWKGIGWAMVIFLAALQGIPVEAYEGSGDRRRGRVGPVPPSDAAADPPNDDVCAGRAGDRRLPGVHFGLSDHRRRARYRTESCSATCTTAPSTGCGSATATAISYILAAIVVFVSFVQMRFFRQTDEY